RQIEFEIEQDNLFDVRRSLPAIAQTSLAKRPAPLLDYFDLFDVIFTDRYNRAQCLGERFLIETFCYHCLRMTGTGHCREQRRGQREVENFTTCDLVFCHLRLPFNALSCSMNGCEIRPLVPTGTSQVTAPP